MTTCGQPSRRPQRAKAREDEKLSVVIVDRSALLGMTIGAAVMFGFGIVWLLIGLLRGRGAPAWLRLLLLFLGAVLGTALVNLNLRVAHLPHETASISPQQAATDREIARHFYLIFGAELAAIFLAVVVLKLLRCPDYIFAGIAFIVGAHFIPLASLFKAPVYYTTGTIGCLIGLVGFLIPAAELRQKIVGLSFGLLLWATSAWIIWLGLSATPI